MLNSEKQTAAATAESVTIAKPAALPRWLKIAAAVEYSALGRSTIYELLNAGKIRSHRVGGSRVIDRESLDAFISSQPSHV